MSSYKSNLPNTSDPSQQHLKSPQGPFPILPSGIMGFPPGLPGTFPPSPESFAGLTMPMLPPNLLLAMQSNLPPEKVREILNEQADMLESMVSKMKIGQEDDEKRKNKPADESEIFRANNSRRAAEVDPRGYENVRDLRENKGNKEAREREFRDFDDYREPKDNRDIKDIRDYRDYRDYRDPRDCRDSRDYRDPRDSRDYSDSRDNLADKRRYERKDEFYSQRDSDSLKQELASVKLREESTYLELQKVHHQIHMLESQLLELQRKHFTEFEHLNFDNIENKRNLEAAEFRNTSLMKENDYLKGQIAVIKRQQESSDRDLERESREMVGAGDGYKRERRENREGKEFRETSKGKEDKDLVHKKDVREYRDATDEPYRRETGKRLQQAEAQSNEKTYDDTYNRRKPVLKVEPIIDFEPKKKEYIPVRTIVNTSNSVTEALTWNTHKRTDRNPLANDNLQEKLNDLISYQNRLKSEIERVSEIRSHNVTKRKSDLELELSICESNINSLTAKLRKMNWLSNS